MQEWPLTPTDLPKVEEACWASIHPNIFNYMAGSENTSKSAIFVSMKNLRFADSYLRHCHAVDRVEHLITVVGS